jgi:hypothetical protein
MTTPELILAIATALTTAVTAWAAVRKANQLTAFFLSNESPKRSDVSVTQALIDNAFALLKVGVASYFGKAALENRIKLANIYPKLKNKIFGEQGGCEP